MMIGSLDQGELARRLRGTSLIVKLGLMNVRFGISDPASIGHFRHLYGNHMVADDGAVPDFTFTLHSQRGGRSRLARFGRMELDGVPTTKPFEWRFAWPMFEWGLHDAVARRGGFALMLHASVVSRAGRALILPARTGSGKSTLCALLVADGWDFVSDEFLVLVRSGEQLQVRSLPQPIALKGRSIDILRTRFPASDWSREWPHASKGLIRYLRPPPEGSGDVVRPGWIVLPRYQEGAGTEMTPIPRRDAFLALGPNAFNYHLRGLDGFREAAAMVRSCRCASLSFGDGSEAISALDIWTRQE
ncbi:MAG TPA: HprK-related kinase A [Gemmatimonadales bacterium]|nr:HprK-related kinase A [Gemmatimonadales bacterium]